MKEFYQHLCLIHYCHILLLFLLQNLIWQICFQIFLAAVAKTKKTLHGTEIAEKTTQSMGS